MHSSFKYPCFSPTDFPSPMSPKSNLIAPLLRQANARILIALLSVFAAMSSYAITDKKIGADLGADGADGMAPSGSGSNGGAGETVIADAGFTIANTDNGNIATATGGRGGRGGNGAAGNAASPNGGNGGDGGEGGSAMAQSRTAGNTSSGNAQSTATGGAGGDGGAAGMAFPAALTELRARWKRRPGRCGSDACD